MGLLLLLLDFVRPVCAVSSVQASAFGSWLPSFRRFRLIPIRFEPLDSLDTQRRPKRGCLTGCGLPGNEELLSRQESFSGEMDPLQLNHPSDQAANPQPDG